MRGASSPKLVLPTACATPEHRLEAAGKVVDDAGGQPGRPTGLCRPARPRRPREPPAGAPRRRPGHGAAAGKAHDTQSLGAERVGRLFRHVGGPVGHRAVGVRIGQARARSLHKRTTRRPSFSAARRPSGGNWRRAPGVRGTTAPPRLRGRRTRRSRGCRRPLGGSNRPSARGFRPVLRGRDAAGDVQFHLFWTSSMARAPQRPAASQRHCPRGHHPARIGTQLDFGCGDVRLELLNTGRPGNGDHARQAYQPGPRHLRRLGLDCGGDVRLFRFRRAAVRNLRVPNRTEMTDHVQRGQSDKLMTSGPGVSA